jgi:ABC-type transport system involved in cytochrome c biogenesis permease subunit
VLFPAGFVFSAEAMELPPALQSWLFGPHVAVYMISYMVLAKSAFSALMELTAWTNRPSSLLGFAGGLLGAGIGDQLPIIPNGLLYGGLIGIVVGVIIGALIRVSRRDKVLEPEQATYQMACLGFPLLTLGLILGSWWGKLAWGRSWGWDPKELWSLASWLVYVGYFHWRYMYGSRRPHLNSVLAIAGMAAIIITLLWVNLSKIFGGGLHSYAS